MGKAKQKRHKPAKPLPTGLPSVRDLEREDLSNGLADSPSSAAHTVGNMIDKLTSPNTEEREYACTVIANCVGQPDAVKALLGNDGIRGLAPLIIDPNNHIRQSALGALRNLSVDGGPDVCKELVLKDVLTPLIALLNQYGVGWSPKHCPSKRKPDVKVEIFIQALHLLANLCESTELAVTVFNKEKLLRYLLPCLDSEVYGFSLAIAAAQCLYSVSEDNPDVAADLTQADSQSVLERLAGCDQQVPAQLLLRTLALGVLCNSNSPIITQATGEVMVAMVTKLTQVITQDPSERLRSVTEKLKGQGQPDLQKGQGHQKTQNGNTKPDGENGTVMEAGDHSPEKLNAEAELGPDGDGVQPEKMEEEPVATGTKAPPPVKVDATTDLEEIQFLLTAQQVALELVTNLCVAEDGNEDWEDLDSSCSSSDDATSMDANMEDSSSHDNYKCNALCLPTEIHSAFTSNDLLGKVLSKADFSGYPDDIRSVLEDHEMWTSIVKSQKTVQSHALLCINNLVTCLETEGLGGADNLHRIWLGLLQISTAAQGDENSSLLEAVTSAMRAVIQKLASLETNKFEEVTSEELEFIFKLAQGLAVSQQVRVNAIRISSTIGCILATLTQPHPVLKDIGLFLVGVACHDNDLWVTAEALDSIFDVFGEDHLDPVVREIGLVEQLQKLVAPLKSKMSSQRKHLGEHYPVISTARTNLVRFIKYKTSSKR